MPKSSDGVLSPRGEVLSPDAQVHTSDEVLSADIEMHDRTDQKTRPICDDGRVAGVAAETL